MAWFKVDDGFYTSQKVLMIPREHRHNAIGAWVIAGTWSADNMSDGVVPWFVLSELGVSDEAIHWLCTVGLWIREGDASVRFHDWCDYQPTKAELRAKHEAKVAAGSRGGRASGEARRSKNEAGASSVVKQQASTNEANANPEPEPVPIKDLYNDVAQKSVYTETFETFWAAYPRKQQKGDAFKAWETLRKKKLLPHVSVIVDAAKAYSRAVADPQFQKLPAGWLRASAWEDQVAEKKPQRDPNVIDFHDKPGWGFRNYEGEQ